MKKVDLTPQQWLFVDHYMQTRSGYKAAMAAGYTSSRMGFKLLQMDIVAAEIDRRTEDMRRRNHHLEDQVILELAEMAFETDLRPGDKLKALELLGRYLNLWSAEGGKVSEAVARIIVETGVPRSPGTKEDFSDL